MSPKGTALRCPLLQSTSHLSDLSTLPWGGRSDCGCPCLLAEQQCFSHHTAYITHEPFSPFGPRVTPPTTLRQFANWIQHIEDLDEKMHSDQVLRQFPSAERNPNCMSRHHWSFTTQLYLLLSRYSWVWAKSNITGLLKYRIQVTLIFYLCQHVSQVVKWQKLYRDRESLGDRPATLWGRTFQISSHSCTVPSFSITFSVVWLTARSGISTLSEQKDKEKKTGLMCSYLPTP